MILLGDRTTKVTASINATNYLSGMDQMANAAKKVTNASAEQQAAMKQLAAAGGVALLAIGAAAVGAATLAIAKFAEFDQAMSYVDAATHETAANMDLLRAAAIDAGARTVFSATEAANAIEELGKAGVSTKDILGGGLNGALDLAAAGGIGVADAAGFAATALKQFGLKGTDMAHVADLLAAGAGKAMGSVQDLSEGLKFVGPVAAGMNMSLDETVGTLAAFASQGLLAEQGGTALRGLLSSLTSPSKMAKDEIDRLGVTLYDAQGKFLGTANMAGELDKAYAGLTAQQTDTSLGMIFGTQQVTAARVAMKLGQKGIEDMTTAVNDQGYAADTAARRLDNLKGDIEQLGGSIDTALIQSGSAANIMLRGLVQSATDAVNVFSELPAWVQGTTLAAVALVAVVALLGGGLLLLIPKIYETGAALTILSTSQIPGVAVAATGLLAATRGMMTAFAALGRFLIGPWGIALVVAALAVSALTKTMSSGAPSADELSNALRHTTDAAKLLKEASHQDSASKFFWGDYSSSLEDISGLLSRIKNDGWDWMTLTAQDKGGAAAIERLGTALADLAGNDLPAAQAQFKGLAEQQKLSKAEQIKLLETMPAYKAALIAQANELGINVTTGSKAKNAQELLALAMGTGKDAAEDNTAALAKLAGKAQDANGDISDLADTINNFGKGALDVAGATRGFEQAVDDATDAVNKNGATLDIGTQKGRDNQAAIDDIAKSTLAMASSQATAGQSQETLTATMATGREAFINASVAAGLARDAAERLADQYGLIPANVSTAITVNTDPATRDLNAWLSANSNHRVNVAIGAGGSGGITRATGGILPGAPSASDNMMIHAASGEFITRASQTAIPENRRALEYMNSGGVIRGYAGGGQVGFQPAPVYTPAPRQQYMQAPSITLKGSDGAPVVIARESIDDLADAFAQRTRLQSRQGVLI